MPTLQEQINAYPLQVALAAQEDDRPCPCRGGGWILNPYDFWQECPVHHDGQPHPEAYQEGDFYEGEAQDALPRVAYDFHADMKRDFEREIEEGFDIPF